MQNSIFWMGDMRASLLPYHYIDNFNPETDSYERYQIGGRNVTFTGAHTINGTKNNPAFQADIFGNWRFTNNTTIPHYDTYHIRHILPW